MVLLESIVRGLALLLGSILCLSSLSTGYQGHFCKNKRTGYYANPNDCHGYIACVYGIMYKMKCAPGGLVWSDSIKQCDWPGLEYPACNSKPIHGGWSAWGSWGSCSVSCGVGSQSRSRTCTNPAPANGGRFCQGSSTDTQQCTATCTPVHGGWSAWGSWGSCSVTCGVGSQSRSRTCTNPAPANGGRFCQGSSTDTQQCTSTCTPVHGGWSLWGPWGRCSVTCGGGRQSRSRTCTNPAPANGGRLCQGSSTDMQQCSSQICPDCQQVGQRVTDRCGQRCVCSSSLTLTQCTRIRKEFTSMTSAERELYIQTVITASTDSRFKPRYDRLLTLHKTIFQTDIHRKQHFLTWHRWFILEYENLLRQVNCNFTVAYWDWSMVSGDPWATTANSIWYSGNSGMGGNGRQSDECVINGPFRRTVWQLVPSAQSRCLQRDFKGTPPDAVQIAEMLRIPASNFHTFEEDLRINKHDAVHCMIDGTMCTFDSASAPEFFLHHGYVDKLWEDWQRQSSAHRNAYFPSVNNVLPGTPNLLPTSLLHSTSLPGGVRVQYEGGNPQMRNIMRRLRNLPSSALRRIPRKPATPPSKKAMRLFGVSKSEQAKARKIRMQSRPLTRQKPVLKSKMSKKLGFSPKVLEQKAQA